ncbi:MAG: glycosyltransferase 87 family protein [Oscillospiraceae bacterium]|nr:glycosyltransferase 87 family protein [Oscillospiraceae bacterium]
MEHPSQDRKIAPEPPMAGRLGLIAACAAAACLTVFAARAYTGTPTGNGIGETLPLFLALLAGAWYFAAKGLRFGRRDMLIAAGILLAGMALRVYLLPGESQDYDWFLKVWVQQFRDEGIRGFEQNRANYNVLYLYFLYGISKLPAGDLALIKLLSVIGDAALALAGARLAVRLTGERRRSAVYLAALAGFWFLPMFWLNSAWWAQCDSLYGALCLIALLLALEGRPAWSVAMASLAFAFKLQAVFFLPIYAVLLMAQKVKLRHALIFPAVTAAVTLPALLAGMPPDRALGVYYQQAVIYNNRLEWNASSVFGMLQRGIDETAVASAANAGIAAAFGFMLIVWAVAWLNRKRLDDRMLTYIAFLLCLGIPYLLPHMHDRYFYTADALVILIVLCRPKRWPVALMVWVGSYAGYHAYIVRRYLMFARYGMGAPALVMGLGLAAAAGLWIWDLRRAKTTGNGQIPARK